MYKAILLSTALIFPLLAQASNVNDPMRPPGPARPAAGAIAKPVTPSYRLDSILIASDRRHAVINGRVLAEGEHIGQAQVVRIEATRVTLRSGSHSLVLTLLPVSVKSPSSEAKP